jgi:DNA repair protein RadA/Sms
MAVLETRCGMIIAGNDVYLSVAGGLRVAEPAADMAVAAALASSARNVPISSDTVIFGEIGLSGEVRAVSQTDNRLREAEKLGFTQAIIPKRRGKTQRGATDFKIREIGHLSELLDIFQSQEKDTTSYTTDAGTAHYG